MNRLHVGTLTSIGAVEAGDNEPAKIMFWKRRKVEKENLSAVIEDVHRAWNAIYPGGPGSVGSWVRTVHDDHAIVDIGDDTFQVSWTRDGQGDITFGERIKVEVTETITPVKKTSVEPEPGRIEKEGSMPFDIESLTDEGKAYVSDLEAKLAALSEEPAALPDDLPDVVKSAMDDQAETIAKMQVEKDQVAKDLSDLRDEMATEKYQARAEALAVLLGDPIEVAPVLKALASADAVAFGKLDAMFDTLVVKDSMAPLFKELGDSSAEGSALDQHAAKAAEIRKADPKMSLAEANAEAWRRNPELKTQAREES